MSHDSFSCYMAVLNIKVDFLNLIVRQTIQEDYDVTSEWRIDVNIPIINLRKEYVFFPVNFYE